MTEARLQDSEIAEILKTEEAAVKKRFISVSVAAGAGVIAIAMTLAPTPAMAQSAAPGAPAPPKPQPARGQAGPGGGMLIGPNGDREAVPPPSGPTPRLSNGKPDLTGVWFAPKTIRGEPPSMTPWAEQVLKSRNPQGRPGSALFAGWRSSDDSIPI